MNIPEVEEDVKRLEREMETQVNAANTILIVAALIGSVTFASCLQLPLGYSPFFGSANFHVEAPMPAGMYPSFASVERHPNMVSFYICNSLSFLFAISALMMGSAAAQPPQRHKYIGVMMPSLRRLLCSAYIFLYFSVVSFLITFLFAAKMVFPPVLIYSIMDFILSIMVFVLIIMTALSLLPKNLSVRSLQDAYSLVFHHMKKNRLFYCRLFIALTGWTLYSVLWRQGASAVSWRI